ncbi:hypothetical protein MRB53_029500 [Persea americana]|uniref:Uncharacterized protein n=1 Tax=Persea americana TaxID=3435 RepID=A0ACC2KIR4_PERAE|nr:hypothetical protein MRB53_029500 [Persea americana]
MLSFPILIFGTHRSLPSIISSPLSIIRHLLHLVCVVLFKETKSRPQAQEKETASNTYAMTELSTPPPIGIDLGTTHSRIGVWRNEWVEIIPNQQGIKTTPSCVAFTDTRRYIGEAAEHQATTNPCNTIFC